MKKSPVVDTFSAKSLKDRLNRIKPKEQDIVPVAKKAPVIDKIRSSFISPKIPSGDKAETANKAIVPGYFDVPKDGLKLDLDLDVEKVGKNVFTNKVKKPVIAEPEPVRKPIISESDIAPTAPEKRFERAESLVTEPKIMDKITDRSSFVNVIDSGPGASKFDDRIDAVKKIIVPPEESISDKIIDRSDTITIDDKADLKTEFINRSVDDLIIGGGNAESIAEKIKDHPNVVIIGEEDITPGSKQPARSDNSELYDQFDLPKTTSSFTDSDQPQQSDNSKFYDQFDLPKDTSSFTDSDQPQPSDNSKFYDQFDLPEDSSNFPNDGAGQQEPGIPIISDDDIVPETPAIEDPVTTDPNNFDDGSYDYIPSGGGIIPRTGNDSEPGGMTIDPYGNIVENTPVQASAGSGIKTLVAVGAAIALGTVLFSEKGKGDLWKEKKSTEKKKALKRAATK